jgi:hypothetical protein
MRSSPSDPSHRLTGPSAHATTPEAQDVHPIPELLGPFQLPFLGFPTELVAGEPSGCGCLENSPLQNLAG